MTGLIHHIMFLCRAFILPLSEANRWYTMRLSLKRKAPIEVFTLQGQACPEGAVEGVFTLPHPDRPPRCPPASRAAPARCASPSAPRAPPADWPRPSRPCPLAPPVTPLPSGSAPSSAPRLSRLAPERGAGSADWIPDWIGERGSGLQEQRSARRERDARTSARHRLVLSRPRGGAATGFLRECWDAAGVACGWLLSEPWVRDAPSA